jgi:C4-dicarboxylate transporter DctM subunit
LPGSIPLPYYLFPLFVLLADIIAQRVMGDKIINIDQGNGRPFQRRDCHHRRSRFSGFRIHLRSGTASMLALGGVFLAALKQGNYDDEFSYGIISTSSSLSSLFPPVLP